MGYDLITNNGTIIAKGINIKSHRIVFYNSTVHIDISNSTIECKFYKEDVATLNATNSHIINTTNSSVTTSNDKTYHNITFKGSGSYVTLSLPNSSANKVIFENNGTITGDNSVIADLVFKGNGIMNGTATVGNALFEKNGNFRYDNTFNSLTLSSGGIYTFNAGTTQTVNQNFTANAPPCTGIIELKSNTLGTQATLHFATGSTITVNGLKTQDIKATGNIPVVANNSFDSGNNTGFTINQATAQNLYWIGGSGNWHDKNHWTTNSNGTPSGGCIPSSNDNVFFNAHSGFTATNNTVNLNRENTYCNNMTWSGTTNSPKLIGTDTNELHIGGNLELQSGMTYSVWGTNFVSNHPATTIKTNGVVMRGNNRSYHFIKITGNSHYTVIDNFAVRTKFEHTGNGNLTFNETFTNSGSYGNNFFSTGTTTFNGDINTYGTLNTNNGTIIAKGINIKSNNIRFEGTSLDISNSIIETRYSFSSSYTENVTTLNATNSHIIITGNNSVRTSNHKAYHNITLKRSENSSASLILPNSSANKVIFENNGTVVSDNSVIADLVFKGNGNVYGANNTFNNLTLSSGGIYTFDAGATQTVNQNFYTSGNNCSRVNLQSSRAGIQANIKVLAGNTNYDFVRIKDINATGSHAQWHSAMHSEDQGNNTFMTFDPPGTGDIKGLGDDVVVTATTFPYTITTTNFFPNPQTTFLWSDGSTGNTLTVNEVGTYTCTANYGDGCQVTSSMRFIGGPPVINCLPAGDTTISGIGTPGATITVTLPDSSTHTVTVQTNDTWSITGLSAFVQGQQVSAIQTISSTTSEPKTVTVLPAGTPVTPTATITPGPNGSIAINGITGYEYQLNNGTWSTTTTYTNLARGVYTVKARLTDWNNCESQATFDLANCTTITGATTVCVGETIPLTLTGGVTAGGTWSSSDDTKATVNTEGVVTGHTAGTVDITYEEGGVCTVTHSITVNALPNASSVSVDGANVCSGATATFTISGNANDKVSYTLNNGTETLATIGASGTVAIPVANATSNQTIALTKVANTNNCEVALSNVSHTITVNALPNASSVSVSGANVCSGATATFTISGNANDKVSYTLNNGTETVATIGASGTVAIPVANATSNQTIVLTKVANTNNCEVALSNVSHTITVNALPNASSVSVDGANVCSGATATFTISGNANDKVSYTLNNGTETLATIGASGTVAIPVANATSNQTIALTKVANTNNCEVALSSVSHTITVNALPNASSVSVDGANVCSGATATFTISGNANDKVSYTLNNGTETVATIGASGTVAIPVANATSNQTIALTKVANANNCEVALSNVSHTITVNALPNASSVSVSGANVCSGATATFTISGNANDKVSYTLNNGTETVATIGASGTVAIPVANATSNQTIALTKVANTNNCEVALSNVSHTITVNASASSLFLKDERVELCKLPSRDINLNNYITHTLKTGQTIQWEKDGTALADPTGQTFNTGTLENSVTRYVYTITENNTCGTAIESAYLYIKALKSEQQLFKDKDYAVCQSDAIRLNLNQILGQQATGTWEFITPTGLTPAQINTYLTNGHYFNGKQAFVDGIGVDVNTGKGVYEFKFTVTATSTGCLTTGSTAIIRIVVEPDS